MIADAHKAGAMTGQDTDFALLSALCAGLRSIMLIPVTNDHYMGVSSSGELVPALPVPGAPRGRAVRASAGVAASAAAGAASAQHQNPHWPPGYHPGMDPEPFFGPPNPGVTFSRPLGKFGTDNPQLAPRTFARFRVLSLQVPSFPTFFSPFHFVLLALSLSISLLLLFSFLPLPSVAPTFSSASADPGSPAALALAAAETMGCAPGAVVGILVIGHDSPNVYTRQDADTFVAFRGLFCVGMLLRAFGTVKLAESKRTVVTSNLRAVRELVKHMDTLMPEREVSSKTMQRIARLRDKLFATGESQERRFSSTKAWIGSPDSRTEGGTRGGFDGDDDDEEADDEDLEAEAELAIIEQMTAGRREGEVSSAKPVPSATPSSSSSAAAAAAGSKPAAPSSTKASGAPVQVGGHVRGASLSRPGGVPQQPQQRGSHVRTASGLSAAAASAVAALAGLSATAGSAAAAAASQ